ncbi:MAG: methyltransferase domain-containing protein [Eubacterium sp.]|nr:methyltransferase domain-containing protein [Eubacterium sp.]
MVNSEAEQFWENVYRNQQSKKQESVPESVQFLQPFIAEMKGKRVLDIGCGNGEVSVFCARQGAQVLGIDASKSSVALTLENAQMNHVKIAQGKGEVSAECMDALDIDKFIDTPFSMVVGKFILHHLEPFDIFAKKLAQVTVDNGTLIFYENSANNKLLMFFRNHIVGKFGIPRMGDGIEIPLMESEINELKKYFDVEIVIPKLVLFSLIGAYLIRFKAARKVFEMLDNFCYRHFVWMHRWSYHQILIMRKRVV